MRQPSTSMKRSTRGAASASVNHLGASGFSAIPKRESLSAARCKRRRLLPRVRSHAKLRAGANHMSDVCDLTAKECVPCRGGVPPLAGAELAALERQLGPAWKVVDGHHLDREFAFPDFKSALAFTNRVGGLAE